MSTTSHHLPLKLSNRAAAQKKKKKKKPRATAAVAEAGAAVPVLKRANCPHLRTKKSALSPWNRHPLLLPGPGQGRPLPGHRLPHPSLAVHLEVFQLHLLQVSFQLLSTSILKHILKVPFFSVIIKMRGEN
jgi:hypothetical protein